ncbi:DUF389 domain-containing protein [Sphingomonas oligophenolica]|uniref:DUF389 domain-containing protein n=1 Tax=Sphingomonas oligophenolica TaxID=301154 RepID=A0A502CTK8_9SPHN|nr:DUF389 domain-containing protein [Sphingomonas oligophenolica]TPG15439.1 DUF389 domain-containing protein [Sphingomonas oligophenolica]
MAETGPHHVLLAWWRTHAIAQVEHQAVNERVHEDAGWSQRYLFNTAMSAGIAILGLLLSSPAVVIGAMLISPLMGPIIGLGFALATADAHQIKRASTALIGGSVFAVLFCALLVLVSPLQNVTTEIAARTRPNLFDLLIALFSALAGSYATIRGRAGTIVGVAIATALMPPIAVIGFGLATWNGTVFFGSLLLFVTNFVTIALTAAVMARIYGFGPTLSPHQTAFQSIAILVTLALLAVPLGLSLRRIAFENFANSYARQAVSDVFGSQARISQLDLDFRSSPIKLTATVLTPTYRADANRKVERTFAKAAGQGAAVSIEQYRVGTGPGAAEAAALQAAASQGSVSSVDAEVAELVERLALVAGVDQGQIMVDRDNKRARVAATLLPGAQLSAYHLLESRVAGVEPGWTIALVPPAAPLPDVSFGDDDAPDAAGRAALGEAIWAAKRLGLAIEVRGPIAQATTVVQAFAKAGIAATRVGGGRTVTLRWAVPDPTATPLPAPGATPTPAPPR